MGLIDLIRRDVLTVVNLGNGMSYSEVCDLLAAYETLQVIDAINQLNACEAIHLTESGFVAGKKAPIAASMFLKEETQETAQEEVLGESQEGALNEVSEAAGDEPEEAPYVADEETGGLDDAEEEAIASILSPMISRVLQKASVELGLLDLKPDTRESSTEPAEQIEAVAEEVVEEAPIEEAPTTVESPAAEPTAAEPTTEDLAGAEPESEPAPHPEVEVVVALEPEPIPDAQPKDTALPGTVLNSTSLSQLGFDEAFLKVVRERNTYSQRDLNLFIVFDLVRSLDSLTDELKPKEMARVLKRLIELSGQPAVVLDEGQVRDLEDAASSTCFFFDWCGMLCTSLPRDASLDELKEFVKNGGLSRKGRAAFDAFAYNRSHSGDALEVVAVIYETLLDQHYPASSDELDIMMVPVVREWFENGECENRQEAIEMGLEFLMTRPQTIEARN